MPAPLFFNDDADDRFELLPDGDALVEVGQAHAVRLMLCLLPPFARCASSFLNSMVCKTPSEDKPLAKHKAL